MPTDAAGTLWPCLTGVKWWTAITLSWMKIVVIGHYSIYNWFHNWFGQSSDRTSRPKQSVPAGTKWTLKRNYDSVELCLEECVVDVELVQFSSNKTKGCTITTAYCQVFSVQRGHITAELLEVAQGICGAWARLSLEEVLELKNCGWREVVFLAKAKLNRFLFEELMAKSFQNKLCYIEAVSYEETPLGAAVGEPGLCGKSFEAGA
eukprot:97821-Amphidinium_carterae.1